MSENAAEIPYDAFLLVSFGGPEGMAEVMPFLDNVLAGKNVPLERKKVVAEHYYHFDGVSPINAQNKQLIAALKPTIELAGPKLPIYWGNRNWHPLISDTLRQMAEDGVKRALAFVTAAYSSYSSCRQYQENLELARRVVGSKAPQIDKIRPFYNQPGFIRANGDNLRLALADIPNQNKKTTRLAFTAHSIPYAMANNCNYQKQLLETCQLVSTHAGYEGSWQLAYQSRSGPPSVPWLEPDILDYIKQVKQEGISDLVIAPIGFICDHMEVIYDLDYQAKQLCTSFGITLTRVPTVGIHRSFIQMIEQLVDERISASQTKFAISNHAPLPDTCEAACCPSGR